LDESARIATRAAREIISRIIAASARLLVVYPAIAETAPTPINARSQLMSSSLPPAARKLTGPEVASVRVRTAPPKRYTSRTAEGASAPGTSRLFVATVRSRWLRRLFATARVVVPPLIMMTDPFSTRDAARAAIFSFSRFSMLSRASTVRSTREKVD
jgi:hypothetical protein